jgi:integrase
MPRPLKPWFHKRKNCWVIEPSGKLIRLADGPKNAETEKEARRQLDILKGQWAQNVPLESGTDKLTILALLDGYLVHMKARLADRTWDERKRLLDRFGQFCIDHAPPLRRVKELLPLHLEQFLQTNTTWKSQDTLAEVVKAIKAAFNWGHEARIAPPSPFTGKLVRYPFGNSRRPITEGEFRQLIDACGKSQVRLREILLFCYHTGARPVEVRTARWQDLDLGAGTITLKRHKTSRTQKVKKPRVILLDGETVALLTAIRRRQPGTEFIFTNRLGRPYHRNSIQQNLRRLRCKIGLPEDAKLYGCRHHFGTRAALRNENLAVLAELLGHEKGSPITFHYIHLADQKKHLKDALDRINRPGSPEGV